MRLLQKITTWLVILLAIWCMGLGWFVAQIPRSLPEELPKADVIVVLTGGAHRLDFGLTLLAEGHAKALFITGVGDGVRLIDVLAQASPESRDLILRHNKQSAIFLGEEAENTIGNADETARWLKNKKYTSILLVTSNYHMPRSLNEFSDRFPEMEITPAPVFPDDLQLSNWWRSKYSRGMILSEYHKFLASKLRHWIVSTTGRT